MNFLSLFNPNLQSRPNTPVAKTPEPLFKKGHVIAAAAVLATAGAGVVAIRATEEKSRKDAIKDINEQKQHTENSSFKAGCFSPEKFDLEKQNLLFELNERLRMILILKMNERGNSGEDF